MYLCEWETSCLICSLNHITWSEVVWILISDNYPTNFSVIGFPAVIIIGLAIGELNESLKKKYGEYSSVLCMFFLWGLVAIGNILIQII